MSFGNNLTLEQRQELKRRYSSMSGVNNLVPLEDNQAGINLDNRTICDDEPESKNRTECR